mmetsp:Transcript_106386/g.297884  ORF Transcript_106386/g.297884 Transcript_106386/m.297884 type:complete len:231 (+) Transcript_106386:767-1459(+)
MCKLMTGMPSSSSNWRKYGIFCHLLGVMRFMMSTGIADMYSSATTFSPERITRWLTEPSSLATISLIGELRNTLPPLASMCCFMGSQTRSGWFPSKKAICNPLSSFRNRFMAVNTTVILSLSGSIKSRALAMAMKTSSLIRSGIPYFRMKSVTESSSCASMKGWPSINIGNNGGAVCSFSGSVSIFWFIRIASPKLKGAGIPGMKSNVVNSPGSSCIAKIILWTFHCRRS